MIKKQLSFIFFCLVYLTIPTRAQQSACELLNKGITYYQNNQADSAVIVWQQVVKNYPDTTSCYGRCYHNIPFAYLKLKQNDKAKEWFQKIIDSKLNDRDEGTHIMEPYANYKHNACMKMAMLLFEEDKFDQMLRFLKLAETKHKYQAVSGTSFEKRAVSIAYHRVRAWKAKKNDKEALFVMVEKMLDTDIFFRAPDVGSITYLDFYRYFHPKLKPLVKELYGYEKFVKQLKDAIETLRVKEVTIGKEKEKAKLATFTFDGRVFSIGSSNDEYTEADFKKRLLDNSLFDVLKEKD
ncbi:tetratricopeptide repeat protein [uncultured Microscilla sp.]|uniref:tetratricopeptide repeat protein n=1 Tax=uncultured Microscilla sp. TaxID=432653 RepID=UPI00260BB68B|nr:tetratricopeptide repeat protein [uncultured Microscilla sp.]